MNKQKQFGVGVWLTRNGRKAVVHTDDGTTLYPLIGHPLTGTVPEVWGIDGRWLGNDTDHDHDLVAPWSDCVSANQACLSHSAESSHQREHAVTLTPAGQAVEMVTLRDQIAMAALTGLLGAGDGTRLSYPAANARIAYDHADAVLVARGGAQ